MLFVIFQLADHRYALEAGQVEEILPLVSIKPILQAPRGIAGIFSYRGAPLPVVDLRELTLGRPSQRRLSTRIIVVNCDSARGGRRLLGIIAEKALETARHDPQEFLPSGLSGARNSYLGPVATDSQGLLQWIEVKKLLSPEVREVLFQEIVKANGPQRI
ncbi:MAG TPA: chemotaxis protein CheW [Candidatus Binatia bacterium]|nr:chemotaxis protein CheW [Candidatus Binatia bacterium]